MPWNDGNEVISDLILLNRKVHTFFCEDASMFNYWALTQIRLLVIDMIYVTCLVIIVSSKYEKFSILKQSEIENFI